jgi:hypothetical protein
MIFALRYLAITAVVYALVMLDRRAIPVVERAPVIAAPLVYPLRVVRVTHDAIRYQGQIIVSLAHPICPDSPCMTIDALHEVLERPAPGECPPDLETLQPDRMVIVELDSSTDPSVERLVLATVVRAGYQAVITYVGHATS